jgi:hypothetical protein
MKNKRIAMGILAGALMAAGVLFAASPVNAAPRFAIGIGVGPGYYAPPLVVYRPPYPGPGYYWTDGYYNPYGVWVGGFWAPRGYVRPYGYGFVGPRYGAGFYGGYARGLAGGRGFVGGRGFAGGRRR